MPARLVFRMLPAGGFEFHADRDVEVYVVNDAAGPERRTITFGGEAGTTAEERARVSELLGVSRGEPDLFKP